MQLQTMFIVEPNWIQMWQQLHSFLRVIRFNALYPSTVHPMSIHPNGHHHIQVHFIAIGMPTMELFHR